MNYERKNAFLIIVIILIPVIMILPKMKKYYTVRSTMSQIDKTVIVNYIDLYLYNKNQYPKSAYDFNLFVENYDSFLYKNLRKLDYHPFFSNKNDNSSFLGFYHYGFDGKNDSLNLNNYEVDRVSLLESFVIKGDLIFTTKTLPKSLTKPNYFYEVEGDTLIKKQLFKIYDGYRKELHCNDIIDKDYELDRKHMLLRIENGKISKFNSTFSKKSSKIIDQQLNQYIPLFDKSKIYIVNLDLYDLEDVECLNDTIIWNKKE